MYLHDLIALTFPFFYISFLSGLFIYIFKKRINFQMALPVALISSIIFVYLFTMLFHNITAGFLLTVLASLILIPLFIFDKEKRRFIKEYMITPGFVIYVLIYAFILILDWNKVVPLLSDTSMHWAPMVKTMWLRNDFYTSPDFSIVIHGDYPPAVQLFEVMFSKAANIYREGLLFVSIQALGFAMMLPFMGNLSWNKDKKLKQWFMILFLTLILLLIPLVFFVSDFYSSLEIDGILGMIFAYSIHVSLRESKKISLSGLYIVSTTLAFLCITKQIATLLAALAVLIYILGLMFSNIEVDFIKMKEKLTNLKKDWKVFLASLSFFILPLASIGLWARQIKGYISPDPGVAIFHFNLGYILRIPDVILWKTGSYAQQYFSRHFISHITYDPGGFLLNYVSSISYMQLALLFTGFMGLIWCITEERYKKRMIVVTASVMFFGWFIYCFVIYCVFLFGGMKPMEMLNTDTADRYLRTYLLAMFIVVISYFIEIAITNYTAYNKKKSRKITVYLITSLIIVFAILFNKTTVQNIGISTTSQRNAEFRSLNIFSTKASLAKINLLYGGSFDKPIKILISASTDDERHYLQYVALPNKVSLLLNSQLNTSSEVCNELVNTDYFIINYYLEEASWNSVNNCLLTKQNFIPNAVYRVRDIDGKVILKEVFN